MMGGKWDSETIPEFNFSKTEKARQAIRTVVEKCPIPITFLGFESGEPPPSTPKAAVTASPRTQTDRIATS